MRPKWPAARSTIAFTWDSSATSALTGSPSAPSAASSAAVDSASAAERE